MQWLLAFKAVYDLQLHMSTFNPRYIHSFNIITWLVKSHKSLKMTI